MSIQIKVNVIESEAKLRDLLNQQKTQVERDKIETLFLLKTRQFNNIKELANNINRAYSTVYNWLIIYRKGGLNSLLTRRSSQTTPTKDKQKTDSRRTQKQLNKYTKRAKSQTSINIIDGEIVLYKKIFNKKESDRLLKELLKIPWRQDYIKSFGKRIPLPRLTAWYGDSDKSYTYSGIKMEPEIWSPTLLLIKEKVEEISNIKFNSVLLNLYQNGRDSVAWHSDDEPELGQNPVIASVSLGETRRFVLKHKYREDVKSVAIDLPPGSLLLMKGETQHFWRHQVPKTRNCNKPRINLTFRIIKS